MRIWTKWDGAAKKKDDGRREKQEERESDEAFAGVREGRGKAKWESRLGSAGDCCGWLHGERGALGGRGSSSGDGKRVVPGK